MASPLEAMSCEELGAVIVINVMEAYKELLEIARNGLPYRYDQVLTEPFDNQDPTSLYGYGLDLEEILTVPDIEEGRTTEATAKLRIIQRVDGSLFIRSRLAWVPSDGLEHESYACYESITPEAAEKLARTAPITENEAEAKFDITSIDVKSEEGFQRAVRDLAATAWDALDAAEDYGAQWQQTFPGSQGVYDDNGKQIGVEIAERHSSHHEQVIEQLSEAGNPFTCMLSIIDMGEVQPDELVKIYELLKANL